MSAFHEVIDKLEAAGMTVKAKTDKARSQCPVHQSNGLTLSVRQGDDKVQVRCFAGCETLDVLEAVGLGYRDLYDGDLADDYVSSLRTLTPWENALASIGIHNGPPIGHLLDRMVQQAELEACADYWIRRATDFAAVGNERCDDLSRTCTDIAEQLHLEATG